MEGKFFEQPNPEIMGSRNPERREEPKPKAEKKGFFQRMAVSFKEGVERGKKEAEARKREEAISKVTRGITDRYFFNASREQQEKVTRGAVEAVYDFCKFIELEVEKQGRFQTEEEIENFVRRLHSEYEKVKGSEVMGQMLDFYAKSPEIKDITGKTTGRRWSDTILQDMEFGIKNTLGNEIVKRSENVPLSNYNYTSDIVWKNF